MKELNIIAPEGYEIDKESSTFERIVFKAIENKKPEWKDIGKVNGYYLNGNGFKQPHSNYAESYNKNVWPTKEEAEACLALSQLCQWRDKYNNGWKPDWINTSELKFIIYIDEGKPAAGKNYYVSRVLSFQTEAIRDKFLTDFEDLIKTAMPLL